MMAAQHGDSRGTWLAHARQRVQRRTAFGGVSVLLIVAGGHRLSGTPGAVIGVLAASLWAIWTTPLAITATVIGLVGVTPPATSSTVFGAATTMFPSPIVGVALVAFGIAGLGGEPIVTAHRPTFALGIGSAIVPTSLGGVLLLASLQRLSIWVTAAGLSLVVLVLSGILKRLAIHHVIVEADSNE